jgi:hypothetical protein
VHGGIRWVCLYAPGDLSDTRSGTLKHWPCNFTKLGGEIILIHGFFLMVQLPNWVIFFPLLLLLLLLIRSSQMRRTKSRYEMGITSSKPETPMMLLWRQVTIPIQDHLSSAMSWSSESLLYLCSNWWSSSSKLKGINDWAESKDSISGEDEALF